MDKENSVIVCEDGRIGFLGRKIFSYLNLNMQKPFAYPDGSLQKGDLMLYVDFSCEKLELQEKEALSTLGLDSNKLKGSILYLGIYDNLDIQPICKPMETDVQETKKYIDTYFDGNAISVAFHPASSLIDLCLNGQLLSACIGRTSNAIFCFNSLGLKYFNYSQNERVKGLEFLLRGEPYFGYSKIKDYFDCKLYVKDIFQEPLSNALEEARQKECMVRSQRNGDHFFIITNNLKLQNQKFYQHYIKRKQDFIEDMAFGTDCYRKLVREDNKVSNTTLASSFRLWGEDPALLKVKALLQKACTTGITMLLTGESGTGKTFMAREIHNNSKRNKAPFIHVNCAAIPYQLIESELFGYEEGSFTGAKKGGKKGYFELAQYGTIFLDEITELPLTLQGKLLEVIQNKTFYRVGGCEKINIDVRLIAATNRNIKQLVALKNFREDLYYRINVFPVELPPLRSRRDAFIEIVNDVLPQICKNIEIEPLVVSGQAMEKMKRYKWPGNIRELENVLTKAAIMCNGKVIMPEDIEFQEDDKECSEEIAGSFKEQREFYEKKIVTDALARCSGERKKTAEYLGIGRTNLFEKIRKYGLDEKAEE